MLKLSQRDMREKAQSDIEHIKQSLKHEPIVRQMFEKYDRNIDDIDNVSIQFDDTLDVSAKTVNGRIYLNAKMLDENWQDYKHYVIHELTHYLQHTSGKCNHNEQDVSYLDNPSEIEAFQEQLKYREKTEDGATVDQYIKDLFDKHHIPKKERAEKKRELLEE